MAHHRSPRTPSARSKKTTPNARISTAVVIRLRRPSSVISHPRTLLKGDGKAVTGPKGDQGLGLYGVPRGHEEPESLGDRGQDQLGLDGREALANALSRPAAEREEGERMASLGRLGREALGAELLRVGPALRFPMQSVRAHEEKGP